MTEKEQEIIFKFANLLIRSLSDLFDASRIEEIVGDRPIKEIFLQVEKKGFFAKKTGSVFPASFAPDLFKDVVKRIIDVLSKSFGFDFTENRLEAIYTELEKLYSVALVGPTIISYIPEGYLERYRIGYLSKEELEARVLQKTQELQKLNNDLENKIIAFFSFFSLLLVVWNMNRL